MRKKRKILLVSGARPNFMKVAPLFLEMKKHDDALYPLLMHTGQHYDAEMSDAFFADLDLPKPNYNMGVGSGTHAEQTAKVMVRTERLCLEFRPDCVVVVGDVNSTMAAALAASKLNIMVAHVEAGLRSGDRTMPEEINRIVTDAISDLLFTPSRDADENLKREGIAGEKIVFAGNVMIDALVSVLDKIRHIPPPVDGPYGVVTLHRPSNVDGAGELKRMLDMLAGVAREIPLVFPVHPRTRKALQDSGCYAVLERHGGIHLYEPQGYLKFISWVNNAKFVLTDSGGIQEETTYLGIPCFTLRENTERPITVTHGTNQLVSADAAVSAVRHCLNGGGKKGSVPELWDGMAAGRIVERLLD